MESIRSFKKKSAAELYHLFKKEWKRRFKEAASAPVQAAVQFIFIRKYKEEPEGQRVLPCGKMCSLNRTMSLSVFPREPTPGLDTTVDYVKVRTTSLQLD